jgi:Putative adhesin
MKRAIMLSLLILPGLLARSDDDWRVEDHETIHKTFKVAAGENVSKLITDQMNGFIHVTGGTGSEIQVTVEKRMRADSKSDLENARKEVKLEMTQEGNSVKLYEDSPDRHDGSWHRHYSVTFECEVQVPSGATLDLLTMNGAIEVKNSTGDYKVKTMNGKVEMDEIGGNGTLETMNGSVHVAFARNPTKESSFHTMNGSIDLYFHSDPDADFNLETMHGGVYADFDVTTLPTTVKGEISGNRFVYRADGKMKVRAGKGGPQISLHTMNGAIRLHSKA